MNKQILVIGGGISGLAALHYLKKKYDQRNDVQIHLLEKNDHVGGSIRTLYENGLRFECGPNGFLSNTSETLELVSELGLQKEVISANNDSKIRYISFKSRLHALPTNPLSFLGFPLLSLNDKIRILKEPFIKKGEDPEETVYDFGKRRLGENFSKFFLDPMVSGVFGGNAKELNLKSAFPKIYNLEQNYGSLIKGAIALKKTHPNKNKEKSVFGQPRGTLTSFKGGMGQLIDALRLRHQSTIATSMGVDSIVKEEGKFVVSTAAMRYVVDQIFLSVPAYQAAHMLKNLDDILSEHLTKIHYAPMAVVGIAYARNELKELPVGFGYLIPSVEKRKVIGVLFSSNIFVDRADSNHILFQVMIGGASHPDILNYPHDEIRKLAKQELETTLGIKAAPIKEFFIFWPHAIPQYNRGYIKTVSRIESRLSNIPGLCIVANYLGGVSLNDCIANAKRMVEQSNV